MPAPTRPTGHPTRPYVPPPFRPADYVFKLDEFWIYTTRSRDEDTDFVALTVKVDGQAPQTRTKAMGDLDDGHYPVGIRIGPIHIDRADTLVTMNYLIVNSGNADWNHINTVLTDATTALATSGGAAAGAAIGTAIPIPGLGTALGALAGLLVGSLVSLLTANCDGPVAVEQATMSGDFLWSITHPNATTKKTYTRLTYHPGINSPAGCGANSRYQASGS